MNKEKPMTHGERLAVFQGKDLECYRKENNLRKRIHKVAEKYIDSPVFEWPNILINWDLSPESQRFSLDIPDHDKFDTNHPDGFILGHVNLMEFDKILCHFSRRDEGDLWDVGDKGKLAFLIVYLSEGQPISPPLVKPREDDKLIFSGGHHRYAISKAIGIKDLPIHIEHENKEKMDMLLNIRWS